MNRCPFYIARDVTACQILRCLIQNIGRKTHCHIWVRDWVFSITTLKYILPADTIRYLSKDFYPSKPLLSPAEWQYLMDYYIATSPDSLPGQQRKEAIKIGLPLFKAELPVLKYDQPATCLIQIDTSAENTKFLLEMHFGRNYFV